MQLLSFVAAFASLGVISPARAVSLCRIKCHKWLINKGPAAPLMARFRRSFGLAAPLAALIWGKTGARAPLGRYTKMKNLFFVSKVIFCPSKGLPPLPVGLVPGRFWPVYSLISSFYSLAAFRRRGGWGGTRLWREKRRLSPRRLPFEIASRVKICLWVYGPMSP